MRLKQRLFFDEKGNSIVKGRHNAHACVNTFLPWN